MSPAEKLAVIMDLIKRTEVHKCDKCDHTHEVELGLISLDEAKSILFEEPKGDRHGDEK